MIIADLLKIPIFSGMNMIAGELGINREVEKVNMMDAPDIIDYLKPNELLVTTAYHLKDTPMHLKDLVQAMSDTGCAGLGIKTKRYLQEIPEETITLANDLKFPIIELPFELSLGAIVNETLTAILDERAAELRNALEIHKQFTNLIMCGKGVPKLVKNLSELIGHPIILFDQFMKPKSLSEPEEDLLKLLAYLLKEGYLTPAHKTSFLLFSSLLTKQTYSFYPIFVNQKNFGFLLVKGEINQGDRHIVLTIEQAANVIAFAFMQENAVKQYERRIRNEFFFNFTNGTFTSKEEIINRAREFFLEYEQKYICAAGKFDEDEGSFYQKSDLLFEFLEEEITDLPMPTQLFTQGGTCFLLFELIGVTNETGDSVFHILQDLQAKIRVHFQQTISFGVSSPCQNFFDVKNAYCEAMDALKNGQHLKKVNYIQAYQRKDVLELLRAIPMDDLLQFYSFTMQGFLHPDNEEEQTLLETLSVFLETNCQISETAKRLFVHRNTVVYRLEKCEELLGKNLKDSETTLQLRLAFRIKNILDK